MKNTQIKIGNDFLFTFLLVLAYGALFYGVQFFLFESAMLRFLPSEEGISVWDVGFYKSVATGGYQYSPDHPSNIAFFILFPLVWRISHLGIMGICLLNILFFATGFSILTRIYKINTQNKILWLTSPAVYFTFIPYSEALFFMLAAFAVYGVYKNKTLLIWMALFLLSLTRATVIFLAPAFLAMSLLSAPRNLWYKSILTYLKIYLFPLVAGTALFVYIQYRSTGIWFVFLEVEEKFWAHKFSWPVLPFHSYGGQPTDAISGLAMFVGFFSLIFLLVLFFKWLKSSKTENPLLIASCGYMVMALFEVIFYNPAWGGTTIVWSVFRYVMINPFFYIILYHFTIRLKYTPKDFAYVFFIANIVWLSLGSYLHIRILLFFTANTLILFVYMLHSNKKLSWPVMLLSALNFYLQIQLFQHFLSTNSSPD